MRQRVLHVEVVLVVKDGSYLAFLGLGGGLGSTLTIWRDGDGGEVNLLRHCSGWLMGLKEKRGRR